MRPIQDLIHRFQDLKDDALERVEQAAKNGDVREVNRYARLADECESALQQMRRLEGTAQRIEELLSSHGEAVSESPAMIHPGISAIRYPQALPSSDSDEEDLAYDDAEVTYTSKRGEGIKAREEWVARVELTTNIRFRKEGSVTYRAGNQGRVGVAFASELNKLPNRWFLGLPEDQYNVVVLLCRSLESQTWDFVIPVASLEKDWRRLSRSGGQIKFNVRKDGTEYSLQVPNAGKRSIGNYLNNLDVLEKLTRP